jgi:hypothetical protein
LLEWLDELDAKYGAPTAGQFAAADALLDALERGEQVEGDVAGHPGAA